MSPIGRVFLVLNLALAAAFVAFAGTYLQQATNYKQQFEDLQTSSQTEIDDVRKQRADAVTQVGQLSREVDTLSGDKSTLSNQAAEQTREIESLEQRLGSFESELTKLSALQEKTSDNISLALEQSQQSMTEARDATVARQEAIAERDRKDAELTAANNTIDSLRTDITAQQVEVASLNQSIREKDVLLAVVAERLGPTVFSDIQPLVTGTVARVGNNGNSLTIAIDAGADVLKPGFRFAIYSGDLYKGDAVVNEIEGSFCFATMTALQDGVSGISMGDNASTNLSRIGR